ncbi:hypothetical protein EDO6_05676 [Paenibacillus xylanexedens]|nr:hypothetical protein EDO6_05676 [Paenibacillus xylanexedens]
MFIADSSEYTELFTSFEESISIIVRGKRHLGLYYCFHPTVKKIKFLYSHFFHSLLNYFCS